MRSVVLLSGILLFVAPVTANAQCAAAIVVASDGERLAALTFPDDAMVELAGKAFDYGVLDELSRHPDEHAWYVASGLKDEIWGPLRLEALTAVRCALPELRRKVGALYVETLSPAELATAIAYHSSPAGQKMLAAAFSAAGADPSGSLESQQRGAKVEMAKVLTPYDVEVVGAFQATTTFAKEKRLSAQWPTVIGGWLDPIKARLVPDLNRRFVRSVQDFYKKSKRSAK